MAIFRRRPPNGGVECRWGRQKSRFSTNIWLSDRRLLQCDQQLRWSAVQFMAQTATHQWILFITTSMDDHDREKRTEFNYTRLRLTYFTIEATDRHEASCSLSMTAGLLVNGNCLACLNTVQSVNVSWLYSGLCLTLLTSCPAVTLKAQQACIFTQ